MFGLDKYSDKELYQIYMYIDMNKYFNTDELKANQELYNQLLGQAIRMGHSTVNLPDIGKDYLVYNMLVFAELRRRKINVDDKYLDVDMLVEKPHYVKDIYATNRWGDNQEYEYIRRLIINYP